MKISKRHLVRAVVAAGVLWAGVVATNLALVRIDNPLEAVRTHAEELGYSSERLVLIGGGYSGTFLSWKAYGDYRLDGSGDRLLHVEIERPTPLHAWNLASHVIRE
jgi:hypothetical protein